MAHSSGEGTQVLSLDAVATSQGQSEPPALPPSRPLKQDPGDPPPAPTASPNPPASQNGDQGAGKDVIDLTRPVKTEGEASPSGITTSALPPPSTLPVNNAPVLIPSSRSGATPSVAGVNVPSPDGLASSVALAGMSPFGAQLSGLGQLGNQLHLTLEEQQQAYKKANLLALSALAKRGGPNVREMLGVQAKLQEFLTNLISLAGKQGPHLKLTVQSLVQKLVTGSITEEEFAAKIETDLQSQHQPSLLPFLQSSVPHLRMRLQLQQAIMKELLQKQARDHGRGSQQSSPTAATKSTTLPQVPSTSSAPPTMLPPTTSAPVMTQSTAKSGTGLKAGLTPALGGVTVPSQAPPTSSRGSSFTPAKLTPQQLTQLEQLSKLPPIQRQVLISKIPPEQRASYLQLLNSPQLKNSTTNSPLQAPATNTQTIARGLPLAAQVNQVALSTSSSSSSPSSAFSFSATSSSSSSVAQRTILERQLQLVKEQQVPIVVGAKGPVGLTARGISQASSSSSMAISQGGSPLSSPKNSLTVHKKTSPDLKASSSPARSLSPALGGKGKGKKDEKGKGADGEDDDEDEGMDMVAGVNLKEETAHFLPQSLGEGVRKVSKDEVFLNLSPLRTKVASMMRRYGVTEVSDDFLVLLSHATQERVCDILEKLTVISQHRMEVLKDNSQYEVTSEVRGQLKVLEKIDRINHKRKQEREKEKIFRAAKSRSKVDDPEMAAKIKEQAKQLQLEEELKIRNQAANATALAAIGSRRKRTAAMAGLQQDMAAPSSLSGGSEAGPMSSAGGGGATLPVSQARLHKRRITGRDVIFYMEQEQETRKSTLLYKSLLK